MKRRIFSAVLIIAFIVMSLSGCGEDEKESSENRPVTGSAVSSSEKPKASSEPEYLYDEFINSEAPDTSELGKDEGTDEEAKEVENDIKKVEKELKTVKKEYRKNGVVEEGDVHSYLWAAEEKLGELYDNGEIADYKEGKNCIEVTLNSGVTYIISPEIKDCDAGGSGTKIQVATYQPCRSSQIKDKVPVRYLDKLDEGAELVADQLEQYEFYRDGSDSDNDFEDEEVSLESILRFQNYNLIMWHGHGGYTDTLGSYMVVGVEVTKANNKKYMKDLIAGRLICMESGYYAITSGFIEKYISDGALKNSIIYLGACCSGESDLLPQSFLDKGAMAVYANSGTINTQYNLSMIYSVAQGLTRQSGTGTYYTTEEALEYAKEKNGSYDTHGTETKLYTNPDNGVVALDWYQDYVKSERDVVMVLDASGSMSGEPLRETKEAASKFVDTVLEQEARIALVSYGSSASLRNNFSTQKEALNENINALDDEGGTNTYEALQMADQKLERSSAKKKIILLMTDGLPNEGEMVNGSYEEALVQYCEEMKNKGYYIYTLGFFSQLYDEDKAVPQQMLQDMASPGCHYEVQDASDLVYFFDDIAQQIGGAGYVYIRIACPVDVTVSKGGETLSSSEEEKNTRTSFGSLMFEGESDEIKVLRLKSDAAYDVDIQGTGDGTMDYAISYMDENGEYSDKRTFSKIPITPETKIDTNTDGSDSTILELDSDGDGEVDKTYEAGANEEGKEVEKKSNWILYVAIGGGSAALIAVIIIIIVVCRKKKKKSSSDDSLKQPVLMPALICIQGEYQGGVFEVPAASTISIGRENTCNIILSHPKISRMHCMIYASPGGGYQVMDYSSNGTYVNDMQIPKGTPYYAMSGQLITIGKSGNVFQLR
ncbi:MAG: VWA domain-containing protein [Roseburia sp.]|nr:VWA domain-containing protein [Roseburia sp.]